jgi:hypothetical protein
LVVNDYIARLSHTDAMLPIEDYSIHCNQKVKYNVVYLLMINRPQFEYATIFSAMIKAKVATERTGQPFVVFIADQQLYKIAVHIMWENHTLFNNVHLRLGGMHLLMSYVGSVGSLMAGSGIVEILGTAFAGVMKMMTGKKFPGNIRAMRMLTEMLLQPIFEGSLY